MEHQTNSRFTDYSCKDFITVLSGKAPVPGGGGASALAGAIGIALGNMVGSLTVGKKTYAAVEEDIIQCKKKADDITARLLDLVEKDAEAFEPLSAAYGMPKSTPEEIEKRLGYARRCTAHLEHIIYIVEPHERSPAYIAAAPSGMATSCTVKVPGRIKPREIGAKAYVAGAVGRSKMQVAVALPGAVEAKAVKARAFTAGTVERSHTAINIVIGGQTT